MRGRIVTLWWKRSLEGLVGLGLLCGAAREARADSNGVKGTVGGAMLGAEVVMLTESAFRLRPAWMYLAGGAAGGLVGGYLGHSISDDGSNRPPSFLLAGGIALIIPTVMGVLTATQYEPIGTVRQDLPDDGASDGDDGDEPEPPGDADSSEDSSDGSAAREDGERAATPRLELPSVGLAQAFSRDELTRFRARQVTELHVVLLRGVF